MATPLRLIGNPKDNS